MRIPTTFDAVNRTWRVRFGTDMKKKVDGEARYEPATIVIRPGLQPQWTEHTYLHELVHVIFNALGWDQMNDDEGKVDAMAGILHQILSTQDGEL